MKAKEKTTSVLAEAEETVVKALATVEEAKEAHKLATEEDALADSEVLRLQAVVRSEQGRSAPDPVVDFVQQIHAATAQAAWTAETRSEFTTLVNTLVNMRGTSGLAQEASGTTDGGPTVPLPGLWVSITLSRRRW